MGNNEIISVWVCRNVIFSTERYQVPKMTISTHRREEIVWFNLLCPSQLHNVIAVALRVRTCHWRDQADHRPRVFSRRQKTKKPRDSWRWPGTGNDATSILTLPSSTERSYVVSCAFGVRGFAALVMRVCHFVLADGSHVFSWWELCSVPVFVYCQMNMFKATVMIQIDSE